MRIYDYVIVGGGTAGSVLASRLSENPSASVLLIEAGPADGPEAMHDPARWLDLQGSGIDWSFETVPQPGSGGSRIAYPRGKVLGGSSAINAMVHLRGHHSSYDAWAAAGAAGWGYTDLLPFLMRSETTAGRDPEVRGTSGPMRLIQLEPGPDATLMRDIREATHAAGFPLTDDPNGRQQEGAGWLDMTIHDGRRQSAADAYLEPNLARRNLTLLSDALVTRLDITEGRCRGVHYVRHGEPGYVAAESEVVLAAGAIGSPQLLMVSGVGPARQLRPLDIDVVADLPGVGANLQDHPMTSVLFQASEAALPTVRGGYAAMVALLHSGAGSGGPDIQLAAQNIRYTSSALDAPADAYTISVSVVTPDSRGSVRLAASDLTVPPLIDPGYLTEERDVRRILAGVEIARTIGADSSLKRWNDGELFPGAARDPRSLADYVRRSLQTFYHPVGTCRIGVDAGAVVDVELRVRGVAGLRVADASVMPSIVSANTNAAVLAIAERAAELIG
ncbi:hypothetical protein HH310_00525 [Actinoplanes sp. TBRC 11911]|uniref:GMC family oxidoreductase n=1 Tax=Actinoplanes sp. TBRC 11911 TaxID=2729386 RepID=UPI00145DC9A7|nr:GMC family oxidoreductase N-terminal domain-containing protein [Actinoplanes sp. TBRC 11911]NMO49690.1 hypothetical protein [Actinoplanes sp. TBRC 11911]